MRAHVCLLALLCLGAPAFGQANDQDGRAAEEKCRAAPDDENRNADRDRGPGAGSQSLSEMLDDCRGVLVPPRTGDSDIAKPPPDIGETPVIRPDDLPKQQQQERAQ